MNAEIICVGTELLLGSILNTNARFLSEKLAENGIDVYFQTTVGDNPGRLKEALDLASRRSDIVITSGGLGPTEDDITVRSIADFVGRPLYLHRPTFDYIRRILRQRAVPMTRLVSRQCQVPRGAIVIKNEKGTAPALVIEYTFEGRKKWLMALPGPPRELENLFATALGHLLRKARVRRSFFVTRSLKMRGILESQVAQKITPWLKMRPPCTVGIYAKPGEVEVKIMAKDSSRNKAGRLLSHVEKALRKRLAAHIYGTDQDTLSSVTGDLLRQKKETLAVAESCTGGFLSHLVTETPGSSDYFVGSVVSYGNAVKINLLGVAAAVLARQGAVSRSVARAMAVSARERFHSSYAISITGIAGPGGGSINKPVGLVYIGLATPRKTTVKKYLFRGSRTEIKVRAAHEALDLLRRSLLSGL